jgi:hypothetical protein
MAVRGWSERLRPPAGQLLVLQAVVLLLAIGVIAVFSAVHTPDLVRQEYENRVPVDRAYRRRGPAASRGAGQR